MRIVSQDGRRSVDVEGAVIGICTGEDDLLIVTEIPGIAEPIILANYTPDRAYEIFDEIRLVANGEVPPTW